MNERFYISEVQTDLKYKDRRSARRWCKNQSVRILSDIGSNKQYVLRNDFEKAKSRHYYPSKNTLNQTTNIFSQNQNTTEKKEPEHNIQFDNYRRMLSILQNITGTL